MAIQSKPIPALYTVYILRSTVRHASLYIGSTPNPPRRLSQHNGLVRGGAARTSRRNLRPWEMVGLVSGFPSATAALKFEWALDNPHISVHIPASSRLAVSTQAKANGRPRRPARSLASVVSNLHLLLRVPSFARWPLRVHFFARDVYAAWEKWCASSTATAPATASSEGVRQGGGAVVVTDFGDREVRERREGGVVPTAMAAGDTVEEVGHGSGEAGGEEDAPPTWGIHALPLDYEPIKAYVAKGQEIFEFERQGRCVVCREEMVAGEGLHALCSNGDCGGVGHLSCWSRHLLRGGDSESILPVQGQCPKCNGEVHWGEMMKELTLRTRGRKEVEKLLKKKRRSATKRVTKA